MLLPHQRSLFVCAVSVFLFTSSAAQAQITIEPDLGDGPADIKIVAVGGSELTGTITKVNVRVKASGGRVVATFSVTIQGTREDAEGNDEIITGSITGSFDVPVF